MANNSGQSPEAAQAAALVAETIEIGLSELRRIYDLAREPSTRWRPEDAVGEASNVLEHLLPVVEHSIDLALTLLRPWSRAFEARVSGER